VRGRALKSLIQFSQEFSGTAIKEISWSEMTVYFSQKNQKKFYFEPLYLDETPEEVSIRKLADYPTSEKTIVLSPLQKVL
jgi:hypothetical protein